MQKNNLIPIQKETEKILKETQNLIKKLIQRENLNTQNQNSKKTLSLKNLKIHQDTLKNEIQKLKNLEYVIAVVGTMKSGKSMTINAIVGQEILPSREFPMTTLPTLITHVPHKSEPTLRIKKIEPFNTLKEEIKVKLKTDTSDLSSLGEIKELGEKIKNNEIEFQQKYEGQENIAKFLKEINDLMRIAKELELNPPYAEYTDVADLPRIEVEFYHLKKHNQNASEAKLTLLDTPGPDEVKQSELLKRIFNEQLQRASAVTLVVDYTKMNNESDADVKEQVKDVANMLGKKHLFVLLNKFDQRNQDKDETESYEEAKRLIYDDILKDKIDKNSVYPISSKSAFYANRGLCELDRSGKIDSNLPWRKSFGVEVLGEAMWEMLIENSEMVNMACQKKWEKSFFEEPLNNIISTIHNKASSMALDSPLTKVKSIHQEFYNAFNIQENAYNKDIQELREIVLSLENSVDILQNITKKISMITKEKVDNSKKKLEDSIQEVFDFLLKELDEYITRERAEQKERSSNELNRRTPTEKNNFLDWLNSDVWEGGLFGGKSIKTKNDEYFDNLQKNGSINFKDKTRANNFIGQIIGNINKKIQIFYNKSEKEFNNSVSTLSNQLNKLLKEELKQIIDDISQKLGNNIIIFSPFIQIKNSKKKLNRQNYEFIKKEQEDYKEVGTSWWNKASNWLHKDWGKETKERDIFVVTHENILRIIEQELKSNKEILIKQIDKSFKEKIISQIEKKISLLLKELEGYQGEQSSILEERKKDNYNLEQKKDIIQNNKKLIQKLSNRVTTAIKLI